MNGLVEIIVPIICAGVLPIMVVWFIVRRKMNETNKRTQIILAAIEKNPEMDIEEFLKKIEPKKLLKEKLLTKLLWGFLTSFIGVGLILFGIYLNTHNLGGTDDPMTSMCFGFILLAVGISLLINYAMGKRMLAKEIEAEEKALTTKE